MKNILYIGPYRQSTYDGLLSRQLIENIVKKYTNITLRPLYIEDATSVSVESIESLEDNRYNEYDTIIQHTTLDKATPIRSIKHNVIIPILNNTICSSKNIETLSQFNKILVSNALDYNQLSQCPKLKNKTHKYQFDVSIPDRRAKINIGLYDKFKKIYSIIPNNTDIILSIVTAFNLFNISQQYVLLLFIDNLTPEDKNKLDSNILNLCNNMGMQRHQKIITFKAESDLQTLFAIHSSGDIYLPDNMSIVSTKIAELLNIKVVNYGCESYDISLFNNGSYFSDGIYTLSANTIKKRLSQSDYIANNKHSKINNINTLI